MLSLYDTRRRRHHIVGARRRTVSLYVCGVTPYDTTHLGHARTFLVFDVLVRHLEAAGQRVRYVQNVTDIDESILQRAARDRESWRGLARRQERSFLADMRTPRMAAAGHHAARHARDPGDARARRAAPAGAARLPALRRRPLLRRGQLPPVRSALAYSRRRGCARSSPPRTTPGSTMRASAIHSISRSGAACSRRADLCEPIRPGPTGMASRVLGDGATPSGVAARHSRRRS